ncbi:hypothetical protein [Sporomusa sphaeroides]|jgi:hypothetical protein|uniref:Uncharacterized protein n=2 Tax=Sporomusa TaxID=2375 RepID=A0ABP2C429_9FIRM|nr:hypothetical protein [Sporomusa sphaeroides]OLS56107.1 hypothetical protein SPSPH_24950 [Sporomusa sphaeroides DSM 2875]CVK19251.1 hypothetical protein SSPH_01901 [Sporomusa sphaeroides DSM 2875]SCM82646.1 conserved hypothetical protein [uncultured Sporomusa sp.]
MLQPDFQDVLETFVFTNLPALMNPAATVVVTTTPETTAPSTDIIVISPELLTTLRTYVFNNFSEFNLAPDIQDIVRQFFTLNNSIS